MTLRAGGQSDARCWSLRPLFAAAVLLTVAAAVAGVAAWADGADAARGDAGGSQGRDVGATATATGPTGQMPATQPAASQPERSGEQSAQTQPQGAAPLTLGALQSKLELRAASEEPSVPLKELTPQVDDGPGGQLSEADGNLAIQRGEDALRQPRLEQFLRPPLRPDPERSELATVLRRGSAKPELKGLERAIRASPADQRVPDPLRRRIHELAKVAEARPDDAMNLAASVYQRWEEPQHSEFVLEQMVRIAEQVAAGRGVEVTMTVLRRFVQQIEAPQLRHRAQLRMGRLYYEHGHYAKAAVELEIDPELKEPDRYQSLAGLVKAISLVRVRQTRQAVPLLEWVATTSTERSQRVRAAFLLGQLHLLYRQPHVARRWLDQVLDEQPPGADPDEHASEAQKLIAQIDSEQEGQSDAK